LRTKWDFVPFADFFPQVSGLQNTSVTALCRILCCGPQLSANSQKFIAFHLSDLIWDKKCIFCIYLRLSASSYSRLIPATSHTQQMIVTKPRADITKRAWKMLQ